MQTNVAHPKKKAACLNVAEILNLTHSCRGARVKKLKISQACFNWLLYTA